MTSTRRSPWGLLLALALSLALGAAQAAVPRDTTLSKEDKACLDCHAKPGVHKKLANGETLSLYISPKAFAESEHNSSNCEGCHSDIELKTHGKPGAEKAMASKRSNSLQMQETCRDCHKKAMKLFDDSVHAAMLKDGSDKAPLCADCHDPHATRSAKHGEPGESSVLCKQCHKALTEAFSASVHGLPAADERLDCRDCHRAHNSKSASAGDHLRGQCVSCHKETEQTHAVWLPNAGHHLEAVACTACHVPGAQRRVDLRLHEGLADRKSAEKVGVPQFVKLVGTADPQGAGLDGRALWSLLQEISREGTGGRTFVRGRLEVRTGVESHSLAPKARAISDCATCHRHGAAAFQSVTISVIGADGRPVRRGGSDQLLGSIESIGSVGGFYAIGGTRIWLLDALLVLALAAGILGPAAHFAARQVVQRRRQAAAKAAAQAAGSGSTN